MYHVYAAVPLLGFCALIVVLAVLGPQLMNGRFDVLRSTVMMGGVLFYLLMIVALARWGRARIKRALNPMQRQIAIKLSREELSRRLENGCSLRI